MRRLQENFKTWLQVELHNINISPSFYDGMENVYAITDGLLNKDTIYRLHFINPDLNDFKLAFDKPVVFGPVEAATAQIWGCFNGTWEYISENDGDHPSTTFIKDDGDAIHSPQDYIYVKDLGNCYWIETYADY